MKNSKTIKLSKNAKLELDIHPMLGLLIGRDKFEYTTKTRSTYILFILCFSIQVEVNIVKQLKEVIV